MKSVRGGASIVSVGLSTSEQEAIARIEAVSSIANVDPDDLRSRLEEDQPTCVVVRHETPLDLVELAAEAAPTTTIVVVAPSDGELAADVLAAGATQYVPQSRGVNAITDRVEAAIEDGLDRQLAERDSEILTTVLAQSPFEISFKDTEARHVRSSKTVTDPSARGQTEPERIPNENRAKAIYEADLEVLETEESIINDLRQYETNGHTLDDHDAGWLRFWRYPWYEDEELSGLLGVTHDVTGNVETERELTKKNQLLEQFASVVSHDLRNPLNIAQGNLDLARETGDEERFDSVERAHERMQEIIEDLVRLTRDSNRDASLESIELAEKAQQAWSTVETGDATLRLEIGSEAILADPGLLQQVFENLFRNSVEHGSTNSRPSADDSVEHGSTSSRAEPGDSVEHGSTSSRPSADDSVEHGTGSANADGLIVTVGITDDGFYVADDGRGLPEEIRTHVNEGTYNEGGLGISIVQTIADRHGWRLRAGESDTGGALFELKRCQLIRNPKLEAIDREPAEITATTGIGDATEGELERDDRGWTLTGVARNFWRNVNECYTAYGTVAGDAEFVGRITDFDAPRASSKAGLLVKADTDPESPHCFISLTYEKGSEVLWQLTQGDGTQSHLLEDDAEPPVWYRITRSDDVVTVFVSADGETWRPVGEQHVALGAEPLYGLAIVSHGEAPTCTARFEDVSLSAVTWD